MFYRVDTLGGRTYVSRCLKALPLHELDDWELEKVEGVNTE